MLPGPTYKSSSQHENTPRLLCSIVCRWFWGIRLVYDMTLLCPVKKNILSTSYLGNLDSVTDIQNLPNTITWKEVQLTAVGGDHSPGAIMSYLHKGSWSTECARLSPGFSHTCMPHCCQSVFLSSLFKVLTIPFFIFKWMVKNWPPPHSKSSLRFPPGTCMAEAVAIQAAHVVAICISLHFRAFWGVPGRMAPGPCMTLTWFFLALHGGRANTQEVLNWQRQHWTGLSAVA